MTDPVALPTGHGAVNGTASISRKVLDCPSGSCQTPPKTVADGHCRGEDGAPLIAYVQQRSTDLTFYLFDSPAPRHAVRVLVERTLDLPGGRIRLAIIGSSHFLEIESREGCLSEMLACPRPGMGDMPGHAETLGAVDRSHWLEEREALTYRFDLRRERFSPSEFRRRVVDLRLPGPSRLVYDFPSLDEAGSAVTCIEWQVEGRTATFATYHTFPDESTIVQTHSVIDFAEVGA